MKVSQSSFIFVSEHNLEGPVEFEAFILSLLSHGNVRPISTDYEMSNSVDFQTNYSRLWKKEIFLWE